MLEDLVYVEDVDTEEESDSQFSTESDSESGLDTPTEGVFRFTVSDADLSASYDSKLGHDFILDDDDDDLPPFDGWYQDIAQRAQS